MLCDSCKKDLLLSDFYKYQKTEFSIKAYGPLLDNPTNKKILCNKCLPNEQKWTEVQFCDAMGIEPVSIAGKLIKRQFEHRGCCG